MSSRITIDLKDPAYLRRLKVLAAERQQTVRDLVVSALDACFSDYLENRATAKLAEETFKDWDNEKDGEYDRL